MRHRTAGCGRVGDVPRNLCGGIASNPVRPSSRSPRRVGSGGSRCLALSLRECQEETSEPGPALSTRLLPYGWPIVRVTASRVTSNARQPLPAYPTYQPIAPSEASKRTACLSARHLDLSPASRGRIGRRGRRELTHRRLRRSGQGRLTEHERHPVGGRRGRDADIGEAVRRQRQGRRRLGAVAGPGRCLSRSARCVRAPLRDLP